MDRRAIGGVAVPASSRRRRGASTPANSVPTAQRFSPASCRRRSGCSAPRLTSGFATATASTTATAAPFARTAVFSQLVELAGDSSDPSTKGSTSGKPGAVASNGSGSGDQGPGPAPTPPAGPKAGPSRPQSWDEIGIGSVGLATVGVEDGWWESIIIGVNGESAAGA